MKFTKEKIAECLRNDIDLTESASKLVVSTIMEIIQKALVEGNEVSLLGIGTLKVKDIAARSGEIKGKKYSSPATKSVKLVASKVIRRKLN